MPNTKEYTLSELDALIGRIAWRLSGIHSDDLTVAERAVANLLAEHGYLGKDGKGNTVNIVDDMDDMDDVYHLPQH